MCDTDEWSPEDWTLVELYENHGEPNRVTGVKVIDREGSTIVRFWRGPAAYDGLPKWDQGMRDLRRMVACVNACRGLNTGQLSELRDRGGV